MDRLPIDTSRLCGLILISLDEVTTEKPEPTKTRRASDFSETNEPGQLRPAQAMKLDAALNIVALQIRPRLSHTDHLNRVGTNTIAIVRTPLKAPAEAEAFTQRLLHVAKEALGHHSHDIKYEISAGVAVSQTGDTAAELESYAHHALHDAQTFGGGQVAVFEDEDREVFAAETPETTQTSDQTTGSDTHQ